MILEVLGKENIVNPEDSILVKLINDKFGNYVVQKCIELLEQFEDEENKDNLKVYFLKRIASL